MVPSGDLLPGSFWWVSSWSQVCSLTSLLPKCGIPGALWFHLGEVMSCCVPDPESDPTSPGEEPGRGRLSSLFIPVHSQPSPDPELLPGAPAKFLFFCLSNIPSHFVYSLARGRGALQPGLAVCAVGPGLGWRRSMGGSERFGCGQDIVLRKN